MMGRNRFELPAGILGSVQLWLTMAVLALAPLFFGSVDLFWVAVWAILLSLSALCGLAAPVGATQLRLLFETARQLLQPGGLLLFSAFLSSDGYKPDAAAREMSQVLWCCLFTRRDLAEACADLPFERVSDESVAEFERAHLPASAWPPTGWYGEWTGGQDLFDLPAGKPPLELRWLAYRLTDAAVEEPTNEG